MSDGLRFRGKLTEQSSESSSSSSDTSDDESVPLKGARKRRTLLKSPLKWNHLASLLCVRIFSALVNPVSDCDETYNYWEPTAFMVRGYGFQTWEYSPEFALRSYLYLLPQSVFMKSMVSQFGIKSGVSLFFFTRVWLSLIYTGSEWFMLSNLHRWFDERTVKIAFYLSAGSAGVFNACAAYLPQQLVMCLMMVTLGCQLRKADFGSVFFFSAACIIAWPFAAILGLVLAMDLIHRRGLTWFFTVSAGCGTLWTSLSMLVDRFFFGKWMIAALNIFLYNVHFNNDSETNNDENNSDFQTKGQNLYGTEPWYYYCINLWYNLNVCLPLFLTSLLISGALRDILSVMWDDIDAVINLNNHMVGRRRRGLKQQTRFQCLVILPPLIWFVLFSKMAHKEERFMFVVYPSMIISSAVCLSAVPRIPSILRSLIIVGCVCLSWSRIFAMNTFYHAPLEVWGMIDKSLHFDRNNNNNGTSDQRTVVCVGKEWYRMPSSLFIDSHRCRIEFIRTGFDGQLPGHFQNDSNTDGMNQVNHFNEMNQLEPDRFVKVSECDYIVDYWSSDQDNQGWSIDNEGYDRMQYQVLKESPFLDRQQTRFPFRSYWMPYVSPKFVKMGRYVLLKSIQS